MEYHIGKNSILNDRRVLAAISAVLCSVPVHIYRWVNPMFTHDSVMTIQGGTNDLYQISLGRFLQHMYTRLRGPVTSPVVIALFSVLFLALSAVIITELMDLRHRLTVTAVSVFLMVSPMLVTGYAIFLPWADIYMVSLFFAVLSMWLAFKVRFGFLPGIICAMISMGLYQSFIQSACCLAFIFLIKKAFEGDLPLEVVKKGLKAAGTLIAGAAAYLVALLTVLSRTGLEAFESRNSIASAAVAKSPEETIGNIISGYRWYISSLFSPEAYHVTGIAVINGIILVMVAAGIVYLIRKRRICAGSVVISIILIFLMPFAATFEIVLTGGYFAVQMGHAFVFFYIGAAVLFDDIAGSGVYAAVPGNCVAEPGGNEADPVDHAAGRRRIWYVRICAVLVAVLYLEGMIYANQFYLRKDLEYEATLFTATRICSMIEETKGYEPGETLVVFEGKLTRNKHNLPRDGFSEKSADVSHKFAGYAVTYPETFPQYFNGILGYNINIANEATAEFYAEKQEVKDMPVFPEKGCCRMVDGVLIFRLSEQMIF